MLLLLFQVNQNEKKCSFGKLEIRKVLYYIDDSDLELWNYRKVIKSLDIQKIIDIFEFFKLEELYK